MKIRAAELASMVEGQLDGNPDILIYTASKIEEAKEGSICFFANPKYEHFVYQTTASAILVNENFVPKQKINATLIRVKDVYQTVANLLSIFEQKTEMNFQIDPLAKIDPSATLGDQVSVGAFSVIGSGVKIGSGVTIYPQVYIDTNVQIGDHTIIFPGVRIHRNCIIGKNCVLNYNVIIGSEGFGFVPTENGSYKKIAQIGNVILGDEVEIGSNTCIDRGSMGSTTIGHGTKLDNLIQIAHNVQIGKNTVIAAQSGVAGSTKIGNNCQIGGQVGIVGHISIADGTRIQAQSGVASSVNVENSKLYGSPALDYTNYLRSYAEFKKLPELARSIREMVKTRQDF